MHQQQFLAQAEQQLEEPSEQELQSSPLHSVQGRHGEGSRQKQLRWADSVRQLDMQLLHSSDQAAPSSPVRLLFRACSPAAADMAHQQQAFAIQRGSVRQDSHNAATTSSFPQSGSGPVHAAEMAILAQMLEPSLAAHSEQHQHELQSIGMRNSPNGQQPSWQPCSSPELRLDLAHIAQSRPTSAREAVASERFVQQLVRRQPVYLPEQLKSPLDYAAMTHQAAQHPSDEYQSAGVVVGRRSHHNHKASPADLSGLPAGTPVTAIPKQPRDSLEASIWKLSGDTKHKTLQQRGRSH